jgi:Mn2+/Fe2+ NRAMP family transporter
MNRLQKLGPGLLYAGAAVGVSHIVQSTQAGAKFGWLMILFVILANVLKYPFFESGPRYANATGKSLLHGYQKLGTWSLWLFLVLTILTMFIIQAAVTVVTAGLAIPLFGLDGSSGNDPQLEIWQLSAIILFICVLILRVGGFKFLDKLMKLIMVLLCLTTLAAFILAFGNGMDKPGPFQTFSFSKESMVFLISFIGWMPAPLDISVWHSIWSLKKTEQTSEAQPNDQTKLKTGLFDFKVGYWGTMILATLFVGLGTLMLYGSGIQLEASAGAYANQLIQVYTNALGDWSYYLIAIAAFTTMFSTTLTCLDAFGRVLNSTIQKIQDKEIPQSKNNRTFWLILTAAGATYFLAAHMTNMGSLIKFVTVVSFLAAPIISFLNYKVIYQILPVQFQPKKGVKYLSWVGLGFMTVLSLYYLFLIIL